MKLKFLLTALFLSLMFVSCGKSQTANVSNTNLKKESLNVNPANIQSFKDLLFADQPLEEHAANYKIESVPAKDNFSHYFALALDNIRKGKADAAKKNLKYTLTIDKAETRVQLWAWKALRQLNEKPTPVEASEVRGVVIEVPMENGYDTLAVYEDGTLRYINYTGKVAVWEKPDDTFKVQIKNILESAKPLVNRAAVLEKHKSVKADYVQTSILTFNGIYQIESKFEEIDENSPMGILLRNGGVIVSGLAELVK